MNRFYKRETALSRDELGATLMEFGLLAPVLMMLLMGAFDLGYTVYMRSILDGAVQKAARDSALETGPASLAAIDANVTKSIHALNNDATVSFNRLSYFEFTDVNRAEIFTDDNGDGTCNDDESFEDENDNEEWDADIGNSGIGGPRDVVLYSVTVNYKRIFPLYGFVNISPNAELTGKTILQNQPYGTQAQDTSPTVTLTCEEI